METVVILSVRPKWCELIASGQKTVEVRKSKPNLEIPFKVYIYQTKQSWVYNIYSEIADWKGKVIGEFICDEIVEHIPTEDYGMYYVDDDTLKYACMTAAQSWQYGRGRPLYGWHISNLKIYDKPKELSDFKKLNRNCCYSDLGFAIPECESCREKQCLVQRAPQSWCYAIKLPE